MKNITKLLAVCAIAVTGTAVFAGPPPPPKHHHDNDGVRLATDIVRLVGASLDLFAPRQVIYTQPAVQQSTIVYGQPNTTIVYTQPAPPPPPPPRPVVIRHHRPGPPPPPPHHGGHKGPGKPGPGHRR